MNEGGQLSDKRIAPDRCTVWSDACEDAGGGFGMPAGEFNVLGNS